MNLLTNNLLIVSQILAIYQIVAVIL